MRTWRGAGSPRRGSDSRHGGAWPGRGRWRSNSASARRRPAGSTRPWTPGPGLARVVRGRADRADARHGGAGSRPADRRRGEPGAGAARRRGEPRRGPLRARAGPAAPGAARGAPRPVTRRPGQLRTRRATPRTLDARRRAPPGRGDSRSLDWAGREVPDDDRVWLGQANLATRMGRYDEASAWLDRCERRRPVDPAVWRARLDWARAAGDPEAVRQSLGPRRRPGPTLRGDRPPRLVRRPARGPRRGAAALEALLAHHPGNSEALDRLAGLAVEGGQTDRAADPPPQGRPRPGARGFPKKP